MVLTLTGCASLPIAGPVRIGPDLVPTTDGDSFYYSPSSPFDGASQSEILNGFIAAGTGPQNDYAVAREYLSESIRSSWNPNQEVLIQRSSPQVVISDHDTAELVIDVAAIVDADGKYQVTPLGTGRVLEFSFVLENAEWRLSRVPDATVLIRPVFDVVFSGYSVFFLDRQKRFLVPELRWFPTTPATGEEPLHDERVQEHPPHRKDAHPTRPTTRRRPHPASGRWPLRHRVQVHLARDVGGRQVL